ncbi:DUF6192 family protein [Streptomyces sp. NPDC102274]|uniref:DUF6192 family protein n=1 Tax=Streptomyces sp. NPDC102274 TaxID=3366151 RepID=UPI003815E19B
MPPASSTSWPDARRPRLPNCPRNAALRHQQSHEEVAARVTADVLRRPAVAAKVMADDTARQAVNAAQTTAHRTEVLNSLVTDDAVAAKVAADVLRRPEVAARVAADDTARHMVNRAQVDRSRQQAEAFRRDSPVAPAVRAIERTEEFVDLLGAFHRFTAEVGRLVPRMRDHTWSHDEREVLASNIARSRATLDWIETAVTTGRVDMDEELAAMLRGE